MSLAVVLEPEEIRAFEWERFIDVRETKVGFVIRHAKDIWTFWVVLILRDVIVDQSHLLLSHRIRFLYFIIITTSVSCFWVTGGSHCRDLDVSVIKWCCGGQNK